MIEDIRHVFVGCVLLFALFLLHEREVVLGYLIVSELLSRILVITLLLPEVHALDFGSVGDSVQVELLAKPALLHAAAPVVLQDQLAKNVDPGRRPKFLVTAELLQSHLEIITSFEGSQPGEDARGLIELGHW